MASAAPRFGRTRIGWTMLLPGLVLAGAAALRIALPPWLEDLQLRVFDAFQQRAPRPYQPVPVRVVDIDDETLYRMGQWPWPRTHVARLVFLLRERGASAIAFDVVFAEPDRTSPSNVLPLWPSSPETHALRLQAAALPDHDQLLAEAFADAPVVAGFALTSHAAPAARAPALKAGFAFGGDDPSAAVPQMAGVVANLEPLEAAASGNGHFSLLAERDGITRRVPLLLRWNGRLYPSLVLEALRVAQGAKGYIVKSTGASGEGGVEGAAGVVSVKVGQLVIPTGPRGRAWLYSTEVNGARTIPAWRVLEGDLEPDALTGAIVFIGTSSTGLKDIRATAMNPIAAGVEVHAQLAEQALTGSFLQRPDWADGAEVCFLVLLGLLLIVALPRAGAAACAVLGAAAIAAACGLSWVAFRKAGWLFDPVGPSVASLAIYIIASLMNFLRTEAERRQVRDAFSRYLSPAMVDRLAKHPEQLRLGGETRTMTILFADVRDFTSIAERLDAQGLTKFMNRYLTPMTEVVLSHQGTVDKYVGDCVMAFWNAPVDDPSHALHACQAALAMRRHLVTFNQQLHAEDPKAHSPLEVHVGIGINTGECTVGNFGSEQRFDYSVLGDPVNLASRLEGQSKLYGVDVVLGQASAEAVASHALLELDLITVKGRTQPARIHALIGDPEFEGQPFFRQLRRHHEALLEAYRAQRWDDAQRWLDACLELDTPRTRLRTLYKLYQQRIDAFIEQPPPPDWNGVYVATGK
jgi:adenylate cyclase